MLSGSVLPLTVIRSICSVAKWSLTFSAVCAPMMIGVPYVLGVAFQPRGEVHRVAQHRIVEAQVRTHIADHAGAGIDAEPDLHREERLAVLQRLGLALVIEIVDPLQHVERGRAGMGLM